jgi:hypothetical protein
MKSLKISLSFVCLFISILSCKKERSNGELIFRTGKNEKGEIMQDLAASEKKQLNSCQDCHGRTGGNILNRKGSVKYKDLADGSLREIPYNDSLIFRFLDHELKSDGTAARTGVIWRMNTKDKQDLVAFLKTL